RASYKQASLKMKELEYKLQDKSRSLTNKLAADYLDYQYNISNILIQREIAGNYQQMLVAEQTRFGNGESSVFLINQRENMLFQSQAKLVSMEVKWRLSLIKFYHSRGDLRTWL